MARDLDVPGTVLLVIAVAACALAAGGGAQEVPLGTATLAMGSIVAFTLAAGLALVTLALAVFNHAGRPSGAD